MMFKNGELKGMKIGLALMADAFPVCPISTKQRRQDHDCRDLAASGTTHI